MGPPLPATSLFLCSPAQNKLSQEGLEVVCKLLHHLSILASTHSNQTCLHHLAGTGLVKAPSYLLSKQSTRAVTQPALSFMLAVSATQRSPEFPPKLLQCPLLLFPRAPRWHAPEPCPAPLPFIHFKESVTDFSQSPVFLIH